ncbi:MAG: isochorismatase family protein [Syntrophobacteria bacterium]
MATDYLAQISRYNVRQARPTADRTALLVIDMQHYFRALAATVLVNVLSLLRVCRTEGVPVFFTRHGHHDPAADGGMLGRWWGDLIVYGSPEWQLFEELGAEGEAIVDKNRYSAFHDTGLDETLRNSGVEELIICGVLTNCCCETTAREAFVRDYRVFFVADATATANEELHLASLKNLAFGFAHIVSTKHILQELKKMNVKH